LIKAVKVILSSETWKKKRTWMATLVGLRAAYVAMNEYGMNPFKKSVNGDRTAYGNQVRNLRL
jgi:hypothetical protein